MIAVGVPEKQRDWAVQLGLVVVFGLLLVGGNLAANGAFAGLGPSRAGVLPGWEQGSLLRVLTVWVAGWLSWLIDADTGLVLLYVLLAFVGTVVFYRALRASDWRSGEAALAVLLLCCNGLLIYSLTTASDEFLFVLVLAALIPARRQLEAVGDVQSIINYGLTLTLLLLVGPPLAILLPLLVLAVPLREAEARRKPAVFGAMLLVGIVPVLIVITGVLAMTARAGLSLDFLLRPFADAMAPTPEDPVFQIVLVALAAPVCLVIVLHLALVDRRRKLLTSLLALVLPIYLLVGNTFLDWQFALWLPAIAMLGTSVGWLSATRIRPWTRKAALGLLALGAVTSWALAPAWADAAWVSGLTPIHLFGLAL